MAALTLRFTGWKAGVAIGVLSGLAVIFGIRWPRNDLAAQFAQSVLAYLQAEQSRRVTTTFAPNGVDKLSRDELKQLGEAAVAAHKITINSLEVRGSLRTAVARVSFLVDGKTPPDGREIRYLRLRQSLFNDWRVDRGSTPLTDCLAF